MTPLILWFPIFPLCLVPISSTPILSTTTSSNVIFLYKSDKKIISGQFFSSKFHHCNSHFILFSKKIIDYLHQKDVCTKNT